MLKAVETFGTALRNKLISGVLKQDNIVQPNIAIQVKSVNRKYILYNSLYRNGVLQQLETL